MSGDEPLRALGIAPVAVHGLPADAHADVEVLALRGPLDEGRRARLHALLDEGERARAARYVFDAPRDTFLLSRGALRSLLGARLLRDPASLRFAYGPAGRPQLETPTDLRFSVTHSGSLVLLALARAREVGVDVERVRDDVLCERLAERFFAPSEAALVRAIDDPVERRLAFFRTWTRKEAYLKAKGAGLTIPLSRFTVSQRAQDPPALLATAIEGDRARDWTMHDLDAGSGYVGALILRRP